MRAGAMVLVVVVVLMLSPISAQCDDTVFARANPQLCYVGFPFPQYPGADSGGGGGGGGILGTIGRVLGGLTGGLL